jgi:hypothetical protein
MTPEAWLAGKKAIKPPPNGFGARFGQLGKLCSHAMWGRNSRFCGSTEAG